MSVRAVIFDLDGTITQPFLDFDAIRAEMGLSASSGPILEALVAMSAQDKDRALQILHRYEERAVQESRINPGAKETVDALRTRDIWVGILTRNRQENAERVAHRFGLTFDGIWGREQGPPKPDTHGLLGLCKQFQVHPSETLMVGDYLHDLLCARQAGAIPVLLTSHKNAHEFMQYATFVIENLEQILQIVEEKHQ